jgi:hypothetical protein
LSRLSNKLASLDRSPPRFCSSFDACIDVCQKGKASWKALYSGGLRELRTKQSERAATLLLSIKYPISNKDYEMTFVLNRHPIACFAVWVIAGLVILSPSRADVVTGGQLSFNLDGDAFANGADVDFLASFGVIYDPTQTFMEFAKHRGDALAGRPAPSSGPGAVTDFRDIRDTWSRPSSTGLTYDFNTNMALQTLQFDPGTIQASGATGNIRFLGGDSFWYGNDPIIDTGSIWLQYGNMDLTYDANRVGGGNSGWYFRNNVLAPLEIFDVRNVVIDTTPGVLNISGDLYTAPEFRDNPFMPFFIKSGMNVGTFSFSGSAVPEPSSGLLLTAMAVSSVFVRRRRVVCSGRSAFAAGA